MMLIYLPICFFLEDCNVHIFFDSKIVNEIYELYKLAQFTFAWMSLMRRLLWQCQKITFSEKIVFSALESFNHTPL